MSGGALNGAACGTGAAAARANAALELGRIGPDAAEAVPALVAAMKDEDPIVRNAAANALRRIKPTLARGAGCE